MLAIFGYNGIESIEVKNFSLDTTSTTIGGDIKFSFEVLAKEDTKIRLEYSIDYVKANHKRSRKIFKISETRMAVDQKKLYTRKHAFKDLSTRKHYPGSHSITLIVNGVELDTLEFEVEL